MKKISAILAIVMLFTCVFAACGEKKADAPAADAPAVDAAPAYIGTWAITEGGEEYVVYSFNADGTGYCTTAGMTMDITYVDNKDDTLTITIDGTGVLEDMLSMTVEELLDGGLVTQADIDACIETVTVSYEAKGDSLFLDGDEFTKKAN